jgi:hypothetical protein
MEYREIEMQFADGEIHLVFYKTCQLDAKPCMGYNSDSFLRKRHAWDFMVVAVGFHS